MNQAPAAAHSWTTDSSEFEVVVPRRRIYRTNNPRMQVGPSDAERFPGDQDNIPDPIFINMIK